MHAFTRHQFVKSVDCANDQMGSSLTMLGEEGTNLLCPSFQISPSAMLLNIPSL
jgi:hypothetical protein